MLIYAKIVLVGSLFLSFVVFLIKENTVNDNVNACKAICFHAELELFAAVGSLFYILHMDILPYYLGAWFALGALLPNLFILVRNIRNMFKNFASFKLDEKFEWILKALLQPIFILFFVLVLLFHYFPTLANNVEQLIPGFFDGIK